MSPDDAWWAAVLLAVDPAGLGGVRLRGGPGPQREGWLALLRAALPAAAPVRRLPPYIDDSALLGGLDLGASLSAGRACVQSGLLARCDGGVLVVPMAERLPVGQAALLAAALDQGRVHLAREGLTQVQPARLALVALDEGGADERETLPEALGERLGLVVDGLGMREGDAGDADGVDRAADRSVAEDPALAADAEAARTRLPAVGGSDAQLEALAAAAQQLGVPGVRALWQAWRLARASAAWAGRSSLDTEDLQRAVRMVLLPRATQLPPVPVATDTPEDPAAAASAAADEPTPADAEAPPRDVINPPPSDPAHPPPDMPLTPDGDPAAVDPDLARAAAERLIAATLSALPQGLLARMAASGARRRAGARGKAGERQTAMRGRPRGSRAGALRSGARLHLVDTLRAAAPWQPLRRREAAHRPAPPAVFVRPEDFRLWRFQSRRQTTTVFVVDASGSAALHRLAEAKGAVESLLAECYVRRDRVALVSFRGNGALHGAELLLPPTRSLARARRCLSGLPGGGGTPLAAGLGLAWEVVQAECRRGATAVTVVLSDGRANLARNGTPGRPAAMADALSCARDWALGGQPAIWLDTSPRPHEAAAQLAQAMAARYLHLPVVDAAGVAQLVRAHSS